VELAGGGKGTDGSGGCGEIDAEPPKRLPLPPIGMLFVPESFGVGALGGGLDISTLRREVSRCKSKFKTRQKTSKIY
jgi:hypothetical protein